MANGKLSVSYNDYDAEASNFSADVAELTAVNFDAEYAKMVAVMDAIAAITIGLKIKFSWGNEHNIISPLTGAADSFAQRETKWLVRYKDDVTGKVYRREIPCADLAQLDPNKKGYAHIGDGGVVDTFVSAFESAILSPDGNSVTVIDIPHVGRNL